MGLNHGNREQAITYRHAIEIFPNVNKTRTMIKGYNSAFLQNCEEAERISIVAFGHQFSPRKILANSC